MVVDKHSQAWPASLGCDVDAHGVRVNHQERRRADGVPHLVGRRTSARDDFVEGRRIQRTVPRKPICEPTAWPFALSKPINIRPPPIIHDDWLMCDEKRE